MTERYRVEIGKLGVKGTVFWRNGAWWLRYREDGNLRRVTLRTTDGREAQAKARDMLTILGKGGREKLREAARTKDVTPTIGALVEHYLAVTECATAKKNVACLLRVVARARGISPDAAKGLNSSVLGADLAVAYQRADDGTNAYTKGTTLAGAKAVFCRPQDWQGVVLPDLSGFLKASREAKQKYSANSFRHIDKGVLAAMEEDSRKDAMIRRAFILARYLGATPKEISFCRKAWIEQRPVGYVLCLRERPEEGFTLKTGAIRERDIVLADWMAAELMGADDYMVPLHTPNLRLQWMLRVFNLWVRRFIPDQKGACYSLRKQAGSDWLEATGQISQVQYLLGHSTPTTTGRWYATWARAVTVPALFQQKPQPQ